jgi:lysozyme
MKPKPDPNLDWSIPLAAVELIADSEGLSLRAYRCPAGLPTIGWGQTEDVQLGMVWTKQQADEDLCRGLAARAKQVLAACAEYPTGNELGAMVSLQYNIGHGNFMKSTVLKAHNRGDRQAASRAFGLWNQATVNGVRQELRGLTSRRAAEAALYLQPDDGAPPLRMPQALVSQSSLAQSPVSQAGAATVGLGALSIFGQLNEHVGAAAPVITKLKGVVVDVFGLPAIAILPTAVVILGAIIMWQRYKQRIKGWA